MKIGIVCVPYITTDAHWNLMMQSLRSFKSQKHDLKYYGIVNKCREQDWNRLQLFFPLLTVNNENCLARAWNLGIREAQWDKCDYIVVPNLDVEFDSNTIDNLVEFAEAHPDVGMFSAFSKGAATFTSEHPDYYEVNHFNMVDNYSTFMIRPNLTSNLGNKEIGIEEPFPGYFDENIKPAYCEDQDYQYRLELQGFEHLCCFNATYLHYRNGTINNDIDPAKAKAELNESAATPYMVEKFGGLRENMIYKTPFNR